MSHERANHQVAVDGAIDRAMFIGITAAGSVIGVGLIMRAIGSDIVQKTRDAGSALTLELDAYRSSNDSYDPRLYGTGPTFEFDSQSQVQDLLNEESYSIPKQISTKNRKGAIATEKIKTELDMFRGVISAARRGTPRRHK
jgi:hypothetical protein